MFKQDTALFYSVLVTYGFMCLSLKVEMTISHGNINNNKKADARELLNDLELKMFSPPNLNLHKSLSGTI